MIFRLLALIFLTASVCFGADRWAIGVVPTDTTRGYIGISHEGYESLSDAILQFHTEAPDVRLSHIWIGLNLDRDTNAQREIMDYLQKHYPKELSRAMESAGNMHNPKMIPLRKPFEEALMATTFVSDVKADLAKIGYDVSGVNTEKFTFNTQTNSFSAATWLMTK